MDEPCPVCFMGSDTVLPCNHAVCSRCWRELVGNERIPCFNKCPMCRRVILAKEPLSRYKARESMVQQGKVLLKYTALWSVAIIVVEHTIDTTLMFWLSPMMMYAAIVLYDAVCYIVV